MNTCMRQVDNSDRNYDISFSIIILCNNFVEAPVCNSYITGARDLCDILHRSPRALCARGLSAICRHRSRVHVI